MGIVYSNSSNVWESGGLTPLSWTLRAANDPGTPMDVTVVSIKLQKPVKAGVFYPTGSEFAVVVKSLLPTTGWEFDVQFRTLTEDTHNALITMLERPDTLFMQDVLPRQWYFQVTGEISEDKLRATDQEGLGNPIGYVYLIDVHGVEVEIPEDAV